VHLIVRGRRDDGQDLVIARDYIKEGMRDRARDLITLELARAPISISVVVSSGRSVPSAGLSSTVSSFARPARAASSTWRRYPARTLATAQITRG